MLLVKAPKRFFFLQVQILVALTIFWRAVVAHRFFSAFLSRLCHAVSIWMMCLVWVVMKSEWDKSNWWNNNAIQLRIIRILLLILLLILIINYYRFTCSKFLFRTGPFFSFFLCGFFAVKHDSLNFHYFKSFYWTAR